MRLKRILISLAIFSVPLAVFFFVTLVEISRANNDDHEPYSILIVAGQSNAEGVGSFSFSMPTDQELGEHDADTATGFWFAAPGGTYSPSDSLTQHPEYGELAVGNSNIFAFANTNPNWTDSAITPTNKLRNLTYAQPRNYFGPEIGIARSLYETGRRKMIILKVTYGGQSLAQVSNSFLIPSDWNPRRDPDTGEFANTTKSFSRLIAEFNILTDYLRSEGETYTVDGFFWQQGGSDTFQASFADAYKDNFADLVQGVRDELELHPDGFIVASYDNLDDCRNRSFPLTGNYCGGGYVRRISPVLEFGDFNNALAHNATRQRMVRDAMQNAADHAKDEYGVNVRVMDTSDLAKVSDHIHFTPEAQLELGRRFASMFALPARYNHSANGGAFPFFASDYNGNGIPNHLHDTGSLACELIGTSEGDSYIEYQKALPNSHPDKDPYAGDGNLANDDCNNNGTPNYLDRSLQ